MTLERRTPLKRGTSRLKRTRLKPVSDKRRDEKAAYEAAKAEAWRRDFGTCQAGPFGELLIRRSPEVKCWGPIDPHHVFPVGEGGEYVTVAGLLTLCRAHHDWAHVGNRRLATARRLISRRPVHAA